MSCRIEEIEVKQQQEFANDYMSSFSKVSTFFHYSPYDQESFALRLQELKNRDFPREELSEAIRDFMEPWGLTDQAEAYLQQLKEPNSVVVIGGQQAGLLAGPLYTIHKMITIIQLSWQKAAELNVPVIPIFWIAGEDHDFDEINHVFIPQTERADLTKYSLKGDTRKKQSVSLLPFPQDKVSQWVQDIFTQLPETEFTKELVQKIDHFIYQSDSYVQFFGQLSYHLFKKYGLLFIDSAAPALRKMESSVFCTILRHYDEIFEQVKASVATMTELGYPAQVEMGDYPALLFIQQDGERKLLEKIGKTEFRTKDQQFTYQLEELLQLAEETPEKLSNNVITRPLMQESLFPTLAFVGGPGEISYWALYKTYFQKLGLRLPPLMPRISISLVEQSIEKILNKRSVPIQDVFKGLQDYKAAWLKEQDHINLDQLFAQTKQDIEGLYAGLLRQLAVLPGLSDLVPKNLEKVLEQVDYLEKRSEASFASQHSVVLGQLDKAEQALYPQGKLQERMHNTYIFLNKHGIELIDQLMQIKLEINGKHKLIYI